MTLFLAKLFGLYFAAVPGAACTPNSGSFFFIPHWWEFLTTKIDEFGNCSPVFNFPNDILAVGLAILDMLLRIGGFLAVVSIIVAGIQYIVAIGNPENGVAARKRLTNSLIGLAIILIASGIVAFIGNTLS